MLKFATSFHAYPTAAPFLDKMRPHLETNEARNGLMLGLALRVENEPNAYGAGMPYFATVERANGIVVAAMMTPPHGVVLHCNSDETNGGMGAETSDALWAIAHNLYADAWSVPTVHGPSAAAARFAEIWGGLVGRIYKVGTEQRAFELRAVNHPNYSTGQLRTATAADTDIIMQWIREFDHEALGEEGNAERRHKIVTQKIEDGHFFVWADEEPVSLAGITRPTMRGISIGPVYTPRDQRGRGYASSAVACLSQKMLDTGKEFCALFTDLANPTSNSIYQKIGYRPVGDFSVYRFEK